MWSYGFEAQTKTSRGQDESSGAARRMTEARIDYVYRSNEGTPSSALRPREARQFSPPAVRELRYPTKNVKKITRAVGGGVVAR